VGFGFQFDVSTEHGTFGIEVVIYLDPEVVKNTTGDDTDKVAIAMYSYSGISVNLPELALSSQLLDMTSSLDLASLNGMTEDELLITLSALLNGYQLSGSVFAIYGYDNFESANDYSGAFSTWTGMVSKPGSSLSMGVYYSYSDTCWAVGVKASVSTKPRFSLFPIDIQYSKTYYSEPIIFS
jgi:hypothetical protein